jgi:hypothetical protein
MREIERWPMWISYFRTLNYNRKFDSFMCCWFFLSFLAGSKNRLFCVARWYSLVDFFGHLASAPPGLSSSFFLAACGLSSDCSVRFFFSVLGEQVLGSVSLVDFQVPQSHYEFLTPPLCFPWISCFSRLLFLLGVRTRSRRSQVSRPWNRSSPWLFLCSWVELVWPSVPCCARLLLLLAIWFRRLDFFALAQARRFSPVARPRRSDFLLASARSPGSLAYSSDRSIYSLQGFTFPAETMPLSCLHRFLRSTLQPSARFAATQPVSFKASSQVTSDFWLLFCYYRFCGFLHVEIGIALELPDQKTQVFLILVVLLWCFLKHTHKMLDEMCVRQFI